MTTPSTVDEEERGQEDDDGTRSPEPSFLPEQEQDHPTDVLPTSYSSVGNPQHHHHTHLNKSKQSPSVMAIPKLQGARSSAIDSEVHLLPSQLRHRHESAKARRQQQVLPQQMPSKDTLDFMDSSLDTIDTINDRDSDVYTTPAEDPFHQGDRSSHLIEAVAVVESPQGGKISFDEHGSSNEVADLLQMSEPNTVASSFGSAKEVNGDSGALIRANSYSLFESLSNKSRGIQSDESYNRSSTPFSLSQISHSPKSLQVAAGEPSVEERWSSDLPEIVLPTRDWIKMQTRINSLEQEVQHVTRMNILLNQELDKLNNHLLRLTSEEGAGWRKEYEFLVQQVDLMHRQLQLAYSQGHGQGQGQSGGGSAVSSLSTRLNSAEGQQQQPKMTSQLHAEVKDLTASLRSWQAAFQQAEEKYHKKCDGERMLKQTLRERETQLSALATKLLGYEAEFQKSISNYEQLARLSTELEVLEGKKRQGTSNTGSATAGSSSSVALRNRLPSIEEKDVQAMATLRSDEGGNRSVFVAHQLQGHMPCIFPGGEQRLVLAPNVDVLTVSIMSWAALLAVYMLS